MRTGALEKVIEHVSTSIYYTARRNLPLSPAERSAVEEIRASHSIRDQVERHVQTGQGHNGADFSLYDPENPSEPGVIFEGATNLPDNDADAMWELIQRWCKLLSEVRQVVRGAEWDVHVDDHDIVWNEGRQEYDPTV
jgi:hypothetical protein